MESAAIFLKEEVDIWYQDQKEDRDILIWDDFVEDICERFRDLVEANMVENFQKLKQTESLEIY